MKVRLLTILGLTGLIAGCATIPPGAERGPDGTMAYLVPVEANEPGTRIEVNHEFVGNAPLTLKIFGDPDGTFHDFGSYYYIVQAIPAQTNLFAQTRVFRTGHLFTPEDHIPTRISFDMHAPPTYAPPAYYGEPAYPPPYYGPQFYFGVPVYPRYHYWRRW